VGVGVDTARGPDEQAGVSVQRVRQWKENGCAGAGGEFVETDAFDELGSRVHHGDLDSIRFRGVSEASSLLVAITPAYPAPITTTDTAFGSGR